MDGLAALLYAMLSAAPHPANRVQQTQCLAKTIYYEARGEPVTGQLLVADTVLNRVAKSGKTICQVVYAPHQYSWTEEKHHRIANLPAWKSAVNLAERIEMGVMPRHRKLFYYYNPALAHPHWAQVLHFQTAVGRHLFFTEKESTHLNMREN